MDTLADILETTAFERVSSGHVFAEGPLWHPHGMFFYFVDVRANLLHRVVPGQAASVVRETKGGNGTTFDLQGRLVMCEGDARRLTRTEADGKVTVLLDRFEGRRLNRPNDVICRSDGSLFFTDPSIRVPVNERDVGEGAVYRITPDGRAHMVAWCEIRTAWRCRPTSARFMSPTRAGPNTSMRSSSTPPATWCGGGCSPICPRTGERRAGRHEGRRSGAGFLTGTGGGSGVRAGRHKDRHHRDTRGLCQRRVRRA